MKIILKALLLLVALSAAVPVSAQIFGPSNYEDCIIEGMQGVQSDLAAQAVMMACRQKFPDRREESTNDITVPEVSQSDFSATKKLAEQGDARAQANLGRMYANGEGVAENDQEAVKWYRLAAEQGDARGQTSLGFMYANGRGVAENDQEAVRWFTLAAEQGMAGAQFNLAVKYAQGQGVAQNYQETVRWLRLAAEQGLARAQFFLGDAYQDALGVAQNNVRAYVWFSVAAAQGEDEARTSRDNMSQRLTPQELEQAQAQATRCFESDFQDCD
jgi:TPR repeat protein